MAGRGEQPSWRWSASLGVDYWYDASRDELVFRNGQRMRRPDDMPRSVLAPAADPAAQYTYSGSPPNRNAAYISQSGATNPSQQPRSGPSAPSSLAYPPPAAGRENNLNAALANLTVGRGRGLPQNQNPQPPQARPFKGNPAVSTTLPHPPQGQPGQPPQGRGYHANPGGSSRPPENSVQGPVPQPSQAHGNVGNARRPPAAPRVPAQGQARDPKANIVQPNIANPPPGQVSRPAQARTDAEGPNTIHTNPPGPAPGQVPQPVHTRVYQSEDGNRFVEASHPSNGVRTTIQTGPHKRITDPHLLRQGIHATRMLIGTEGETERLFDGFRKRDQPRKFFVIGKVFLVLWVEPAGESNTIVTNLEPGTSIGRFGERVYSKARRFVVIREGDTYCSALPIASYGRQGVSKRGVNKSEHAIIHTGKESTQPLPSELPQRGETYGMRPQAIRVDPDQRDEKLDAMSRLDFGKVHTIQHNIKVKSFGKVNEASMNAFLHQFENVWNRNAPAAFAGAGPSRGQFANNAPAPLRRESSRSRRSAQSERSDGDGEKRRKGILKRRYIAIYQELVKRGHSKETAEETARALVAKEARAEAEEGSGSGSEESDEDSDGEDEATHAKGKKSERSGLSQK